LPLQVIATPGYGGLVVEVSVGADSVLLGILRASYGLRRIPREKNQS
jgi:hypothetical protein